MKNKPLVIVGNEKVFEDNQNFYCDRYDEKSIPEGLNKYNQINYIVRGSNKKGKHKNQYIGRSIYNTSVFAKSKENIIGRILNTKIIRSTNFALEGDA